MWEPSSDANLRSALTGSHPAIHFEDRPVSPGPLHRFEEGRHQIMADVVTRTLQEYEGADLDFLLSEALYTERNRMRKINRFSPSYLFTYPRHQGDRQLWGRVQGGLFRNSAEADRREMMSRVVNHYTHEIASHFNEKTYRFATYAVPWMFNWLLNAASVQRFKPWGMPHALQTRLRILGEIPHLQELSKKGTILLVPTHQSNIDSILIGYVIYLMGLPPFCYGAGLNLFSNPVLSYFMSNLGAYTVDRQKAHPLYKATLKNYSTGILKQGIHSIFFPGGGRSRSGAIESQVKLGLLGTGLQAQIENLREGKPNPNVYVVPMVMSYHFVLEAASLIEDYLEQVGKHRFMGADTEEPWFIVRLVNFFWKFFAVQSEITVRVGRPMDIFGNPVDFEGRSQGPNGTTIDPVKWLTTGGEVRSEFQRDREYTAQLGRRIGESYHRTNTVLSSHWVAFAFFRSLRKQYPDMDLYRFLRISAAQRTLAWDRVRDECEGLLAQLREYEQQGRLFLSDELKTMDLESSFTHGIQQLGVLHGLKVVKREGMAVSTEDMNLLYYYRNRLTGYGFASGGHDDDEKGFLV